jgi:glycerol-3-phosphate dehydrogenase (NAD(P)+)
MKERVAVLGAGALGTALSVLLGGKGIPVLLWGRNEETVRWLREKRYHPTRLTPEIILPPSVEVTSNPEEWISIPLLIYCLPAQAVREFFGRYRKDLHPEVKILLTAKGFELETGLSLDEVLREIYSSDWVEEHFAVLSGPMFALELARGLPTVSVVAGYKEGIRRFWQELLATPTFRVYTSDDVIGVEVAGALKNVIALAAGAVDGLGLGLNARAALITRGLAEITRFGVALGARPMTFIGLAGVGDLILTSTGDLSRNRMVGFRLGRGEPLEEVLKTTREVVEGIPTTKSVIRRAEELKVEIPIIHEVGEVLFHGKEIRKAVYDLMTRTLKAEIIV